MEADFSGYATKAGLKCSDGRTITPAAFANMNGMKVPLVWQHGHNEAGNVLGHALLEARDDGIYAYGFFNETKQGTNAKALVEHKDITALSIYANQLVEKSKSVLHGVIREVSLVLSGANPGAKIDFVRIAHSEDDIETLDDEAVIYTGLELTHSLSVTDMTDPANVSPDTGHQDKTIQEVYDTLNEEQQNIVHYMIGIAVDGAQNNTATHSDETVDETVDENSADENDEGDLTHQEGTGIVTNVFEQANANKTTDSETHELSHDAMKGIVADAVKCGSMREAVNSYALQHGITNIDLLFPDAKAATGVIELDKRRTEWVSNVLNSTRNTPFARIKTFSADLTQDEARAKGYIKGNYKLEEWFGVSKRTTSPTTIYKKQKLDRDDMLDITDFDIVAFLKAEMRLMTEEEVARAILIGDGRSVSDVDKVKDPLGASDGAGVRSIVNDHELFVTTLYVNVDDTLPTPGGSTYDEVVDAVMDGMEFYKGTGTPTFYTTIKHLNKFLKAKDSMGRRLYANKTEVGQALGVKDIITVEPMNNVVDLIGIIVNLDDYNTGTDRGGELTMFDDFDIDYNQQKYLMETRLSGALIKPKSALVIRKTAVANVLVTPTKPVFVAATGVVTIPTVTGVVYKDGAAVTITAGAMSALAAGASTTIYSVPASGYYFASTAEDSWPFKRPA